MAAFCRCERCAAICRRDRGGWHRKLIFFSLFAFTLPFAWLLFVAGPGVVGVLPIVIAIGLGISAGLGDWAFRDPRCPTCHATLEWAPQVDDSS